MEHGRFRPGQPIVLRETWQDRVWEARTAIAVEDADERTMLYVPPHAPKKRAADSSSRFLRIPIDDWHLVDTRSSNRHVLSFAWPDREYAVLMSWHADSSEFLGWYINLQSTLRRTSIGFDAEDHILDIVITNDRVWRWKDEHEMTQAIEAGLFTDADAQRFHEVGERVIEMITARDEPFGDRWLKWSPDPAWHHAPALIDGWDVIDDGAQSGNAGAAGAATTSA